MFDFYRVVRAYAVHVPGVFHRAAPVQRQGRAQELRRCLLHWTSRGPPPFATARECPFDIHELDHRVLKRSWAHYVVDLEGSGAPTGRTKTTLLSLMMSCNARPSLALLLTTVSY